MKKPNYTPGPWYWTDDVQARDLCDTWSLIDDQGFGVLSCDGLANSPQHVNPSDAALIAAAPSLAEALHELLNATALQDEISEEREAAIKALKLAGWTDD